MDQKLEHYYLQHPEQESACLLALRNIILSFDNNISEAFKWSIPCFMYKKKMCCFLNIDRKDGQPYILWVEGDKLNFAELEKGNRVRMKTLKIYSDKDIPIGLLQSLLQAALELYKNGTIKIKGA